MAFKWALLTPWEPSDVMWNLGNPLLFATRKQAREYANERFGYIKERKIEKQQKELDALKLMVLKLERENAN